VLIKLLVIFICVPAIELYFMLQVHALIGLGPTISLILLTGIAGAYLARLQGLQVLRRMAAELESGRLPGNELLDAAMVLVGGILLLTPGFCTDLIGFVFLVPGIRTGVKRLITPFLRRLSQRSDMRIYRP